MKDMLSELKLEHLNEEQRELAELIGLENYKLLIDRYGGTQLYIPQLDTVDRYLRNKQIREAFNGSNYDELARKYGLTCAQIRHIVNDISKRIRSGVCKDQMSIFDV